MSLQEIQSHFPQLQQKVYGKPLVYLDSAATTLIPNSVVDAMAEFDRTTVANVHRGAHYLSDKATGMYEQAREKVASFIGSNSSSEIVFTRGTTESINLVASSLGQAQLKEGDEILITEMEHHSNIVPWQMVAEKTGATVKAIPITEAGELDYTKLETLLSDRVKIVSLVYCSNTLGTVNDVKRVIAAAHKVGAKVMIDAAQAVNIVACDVKDLDCDYFAFSGHKVFGPFGVGVLWGRQQLLDSLPPYQGGGSMISTVTLEKSTYLPAPQRFEAGTPNVTGAIGLGAALDYINSLGLDHIRSYEHSLLAYASDKLQSVGNVRVIGESESKVSILSFVLEGIHPSDVGQLVDQQGVALRTGHHCTQPIMNKFSIPGTIRASFSVYNSEEDVDKFIDAVKKAKEMLL